MWVLTVCSLIDELAGDLAVGEAGGEQLEDLRLAWCQIVGQLDTERRPARWVEGPPASSIAVTSGGRIVWPAAALCSAWAISRRSAFLVR